ncbi:beta-mannosidase [Maribellus comscasis]|uniref:Beta-mannosidase n=1 Tax=Maribellus comscasis TaxID=2681766 RepID=A0A6I6JV69_9BACT|nr:glycosyl hydrolase [Maribellus comscasis]QGY44077.1 beta-mannosidase [Maribellus comscasis]
MKKFCLFFWAVTVVSGFGCEENNGGEDIVDNISPQVESVTPSDGETGVSLNSKIVITYSEPITLGNSHQIAVNNKTVDVSVNENQLNIETVLENNTDYSVTISAISVLDLAKNYAEEFSFSFSTKTNNPIEISAELVTKNPSKEAENVYNFLKENYGQKVISASMSNVAWNINEAEWIKQHTGKYPAIASFDYIHLPFSPANWIDYSETAFIEEWWNNNGLVCASWHWNVPSNQGSDNYYFYADETSFKASNATIEGTWENEIVKADLEKISSYIKILKEKNIPLIWRPLHEAAGNIYEYQAGEAWFWWGANGAEAFKQLWIYMFNYFREMELDNLIWVWTTQTNDNDFYPGDNYVDIIGRDVYNNSDANSIAEQFSSIRNEYPNKIVTLSEMGNVATISSQWAAGAKWAYFMPWYDFERTNNLNEADFNQPAHQFANADWWIDAVNQSYVITRDQMPNLK